MSIDLAECSIAELQSAFEQGSCSALAVCQACLERIAAIDAAGPRLRAVIEINPDAEAIAAALDRERQERGPRGPTAATAGPARPRSLRRRRCTKGAGLLPAAAAGPPRGAGAGVAGPGR